MVTKKLFNSREEWLQGRKNHIGGSDAAACVGLNPYKDNVQLWEEKVGLVLPEDISDAINLVTTMDTVHECNSKGIRAVIDGFKLDSQ